MRDFLSAVWLLSILGVLLGGIPYAIWLIYTAIKKRWRRLFVLLSAPVLFFLILYVATDVCDSIAYRRYLRSVYDADVCSLGEPIFEYDSPRYWNGDGYSFAVYNLPEAIETRFRKVDESLLAEFPKKPDYRGRWSAVRWQRAPMATMHDGHLKFALSRYDADTEKKLNAYFEDIREALKQNTTYYALFEYSPKAIIHNIDLFIIDLKHKKLYVINHNT